MPLVFKLHKIPGRQKVARTHLRLPKMRTIIPPQILRELDRECGLSGHPPAKHSGKRPGRLFRVG